jgi:hypothetical protein
MAPKKKEDGLLGPDGKAFSQAVGGIGKQIKRYTDWRSAHNKKVSDKKKPAKKKPSKYIPASKRPADMKKGTVYGQDSKSTGRNWSKPYGQKSDKPSSGDPKTWKKAASKPDPKPKPKPTKKPTATKPAAPAKKAPAKKKPAYNKPSTTKGPTKSGNYIASKGSSTKGGPTADGKTYKNQIKSKRLRDALSNLKVRKYKK